jgi:DeoR/GlpR family transcriptional regulator of sugar metabolism
MKPLRFNDNHKSRGDGANRPLLLIDSAAESALPAKRHLDILHLIQHRGQLTVQELASYLQVSNDTVRRHLDYLASQGRLTRTYGGAVANEKALQDEPTFAQRMGARSPEKRRIVRAACLVIGMGETLLINGGSTSALFGGEIEHHYAHIDSGRSASDFLHDSRGTKDRCGC